MLYGADPVLGDVYASESGKEPRQCADGATAVALGAARLGGTGAQPLLPLTGRTDVHRPQGTVARSTDGDQVVQWNQELGAVHCQIQDLTPFQSHRH